MLWWALIALIGFGVLGILVSIPAGSVIYALGGLVIFAGLVTIDFQRLQASSELDSAPLLAASIFHFEEHTIAAAKALMAESGVVVRPVAE